MSICSKQVQRCFSFSKHTFNSAGDEEESIAVVFAQVARMQPALRIQSFLSLLWHAEVTHEDVATPVADFAIPICVWFVQLGLAPWDLLAAAVGKK